MNIPKRLQPHLDAAFPARFITLATTLSDGYAQVSPRGSTQVYDDQHLSTWERDNGGRSAAEIRDGTKMTFFFANPELRPQGLAFVRLYGIAKVYRSGPQYEKVWERLIAPEKRFDAEKKGFAVLCEVTRVEDLRGNPIAE